MRSGWTVTLCAVAALMTGVAVSGPHDRTTVPTHAADASTDAVRISFPSDRLPTLSMPDGEVRPVRSLLNTPTAMHYGEFRWNDAAVPEGDTWVRIDLAQQTISVFRAGHEIGTAVILYGTDGKPTPTGIFPILAKATQHRSSLYDAEMPYMLRLTGDGVAIHASAVRRGSATHGCIGVPEAFARQLFAVVKRGDPVAILPATTGSPHQRT
ncbi:L,D-transpeptidase family protein [Sphingomonas sp. 1P08PE]|uniref:L,D-transpeptidase family protein n=1 Tax=Sphingomonas sp. 1P08PE TaxID=554122 RepID=UPI0039A0F01B